MNVSFIIICMSFECHWMNQWISFINVSVEKSNGQCLKGVKANIKMAHSFNTHHTQ